MQHHNTRAHAGRPRNSGFAAATVFFAIILFTIAPIAPIARAFAQAPVITPKGDPSVHDDTIYSLVVKAADHPEEATAMLLDDGVVRFEKDGTGVQTYRSVVQLLKQSAVDSWSEQTFSYDGDREEFVLNWARVLDLDGKVLSAQPLHVQTLDAEVPEGSPIYTHQKTVHVSLASVAPGRIIDISYTTRTKQPVMPGDFHGSWVITTGRTVRRSRLVLDLPADSRAPIREFNMTHPATVAHAGNRVVRTWFAADQPYMKSQMFASDSNSVLAHLAYSGEVGWGDIAKWYASLARDRYTMTPSLKTWLATNTAKATTPREKLVAVHRFIAQDVRYVSLSLGIGGYKPRMPDEVLNTAAGDCKDKATAFVTLARGLGFEAYPVLVSASTAVDSTLPTTSAFDHEIAAVKIDGAWIYADLTDPFTPFGDPVGVMDDDFGLMVRDDGHGDLIHFPPRNITANTSRNVVTGTLDATGHFIGSVDLRMTGATAAALRSQFPDSLTADQIDRVKAAVAHEVFEGATGDSLDITRGLDLAVPPHIRVTLTAQPVKTMEDGAIIKLPLDRTKVEQAISSLKLEPERTFWFNAIGVFGEQENTSELLLTLPPGWTVKLPPAVHASSAFGEYDATFEQQGNQLHVVRHTRGARGILPPSAKAQLLDWLDQITKDDTEVLVLRHATN